MKESIAINAGKLYENALAIMTSQNGDPDTKEAARLLRTAWRMGEPRAAYALGTWYFYGTNGFKKNIKKGIELITAAADAKVPDALFDLAVCYEVGEGVELALEKAFISYLDAAVRGDKQAVAEVGRCYFFGIGVGQNLDIAEIWDARAEELGTYRSE